MIDEDSPAIVELVRFSRIFFCFEPDQWPIPSISGVHVHYAYNSTACIHMYRMCIANALRRGLAL